MGRGAQLGPHGGDARLCCLLPWAGQEGGRAGPCSPSQTPGDLRGQSPELHPQRAKATTSCSAALSTAGTFLARKEHPSYDKRCAPCKRSGRGTLWPGSLSSVYNVIYRQTASGQTAKVTRWGFHGAHSSQTLYKHCIRQSSQPPAAKEASSLRPCSSTSCSLRATQSAMSQVLPPLSSALHDSHLPAKSQILLAAHMSCMTCLSPRPISPPPFLPRSLCFSHMGSLMLLYCVGLFCPRAFAQVFCMDCFPRFPSHRSYNVK